MRVTRSVITGAAIPGKSGVTLFARLRGNAGALITQASLTSITYAVLDLTSGVSLGTGTFAVSTTVYDALQQGDPRWQVDTVAAPGRDGSSGYNFAGTLPASLFVARTIEAIDLLAGQQPAPHEIQAEVIFTPVSGEPWRVVFRWREVVVYG